MVVDIVKLPHRQCHIAGGFYRRAVVIQGFRHAGRHPICVQRAAQRQFAAAVNERMVEVVNLPPADLDALAPGDSRRHAVFREVIQRVGLNAQIVAVDPAGAAVGQRAGHQPRLVAVNQAIVGQRVRHRQPGVTGGDFARGGIKQVARRQIEPCPRQQPTAVRYCPRRGQGEIAVGDHFPTVIDRFMAAQRHIAERQQLTVPAQAVGLHAHLPSGFRRPGGVDQIQGRAAERHRPARRQFSAAVIKVSVIDNGKIMSGQHASGNIIQFTAVDDDILSFNPLFGMPRVAVNQRCGVQRRRGSAAYQPQRVINHALRGADQQVAEDLYLPAVVKQLIQRQGGTALAYHAPAAAVIQPGGL